MSNSSPYPHHPAQCLAAQKAAEEKHIHVGEDYKDIALQKLIYMFNAIPTAIPMVFMVRTQQVVSKVALITERILSSATRSLMWENQ